MPPEDIRRRKPPGTFGKQSKVNLLPEDIGGLARRLPPAEPGTLFILGLNGGMRIAPDAGFRVTFGRHPQDVHICVGTGDDRVSRHHGHVERQGPQWILHNTGRRPIRFPDAGRVLAGDRRALPGGYTPLFIVCDDREHLLEVRVTTNTHSTEAVVPFTDGTRESRKWVLTESEHLAVVCLGQRYLEADAFPQPLTWKETADRLTSLQPGTGWDHKRVQRTITEIRARLSGNGVRGLTREEVGEPVGNLLNHNLIMELLTTASLLPEDLSLLTDLEAAGTAGGRRHMGFAGQKIECAFNMLNMHSMPEDRSTAAVIRDAALRLFAEAGPEKATVQQIATAAKVSPGLVIHHFGSKDGLRARVDEYVAAVFDTFFATFDTEALPTGDLSGSFADALLAHLPPDSPVPRYLRRLWLSGDEAGRRLFRRWFDVSLAWMRRLEARGIVRPAPDPQVRNALLMVNDLSVLLFRDHLADVLGTDLLTGDGMRRWAAEAMDLYQGGLFTQEES